MMARYFFSHLVPVSAVFVFAVSSTLPVAAEAPASGGGNITIRSDKQIFAQDQNLVRAVGNVTIQKEDTTASSPEAIIMLGDGGAASKVIFVKGATLNQGDRRMSAERIVVNSSDNTVYAEHNVVTTIQSKTETGQPTTVKVKSDTQQAHSDTGMLFANGHVDINYEDFKAKGPKAVFHSKNNELEKIVMNGRSQVEDKDRKVTGDTVVITTKPKKFNADGNVTTQIKSKPKTAVASAGTPAAAKAATSAVGATKSSTTALKSSPSKAASARALQAQMMEEEKRLHELLKATEDSGAGVN